MCKAPSHISTDLFMWFSCAPPLWCFLTFISSFLLPNISQPMITLLHLCSIFIWTRYNVRVHISSHVAKPYLCIAKKSPIHPPFAFCFWSVGGAFSRIILAQFRELHCPALVALWNSRSLNGFKLVVYGLKTFQFCLRGYCWIPGDSCIVVYFYGTPFH